MASTLYWKSADLEALPDDEGTRYEIIGGELFVSKQPHFYHQDLCGKIYKFLEIWSDHSKQGKTIFAPGLIFADDDDVIPDVAWLSNERLAASLGDDGKLHSAPDLIIEVLSPGPTNQRRDRDAKLNLYSRRGVLEYWIVDWKTHSIEVYREQSAQLIKISTLVKGDVVDSPLLPGFSVRVEDLFAGVP
jgi:Uma2 family endonuclease